MKKTLLALLTILIFCACSDENAQLKKGMLLLDKKQNAAAAKLFTSVINNNPDLAAAYAARASAFERLAKETPRDRVRLLNMAEEDYFSALALSPNNAEILNNLGAYYIDRKMFPNALVYLNDAVRANPRYSLAYTNRGIANYQTGRGTVAWSDFNMALQLNPVNLLARYNRAVMFADWEMYEPAIDDFSFIIDRDPNARVLVERGRALMNFRYYTQALEDFEQATLSAPDYPLGHYYYGLMLFKRGDYEAALAQLTITKELNNTFAPAYDLMGDMLAVEDPVAAAANYVVARRLDPDNAPLYTQKMQKMLTDAGREEVVRNIFE